MAFLAKLALCAFVAVSAEEESAADEKDIETIYAEPHVDALHFSETFDGDVWSRWTKSKAEKYNGEFKVGSRKEETLIGDLGLTVPAEAKHYAASASFKAVEGKKDVSFVIQFEVAFQTGLTCGGSYLKFFNSDGKAADEFDGDTPYVIMFGPDKCGGTNKVHFILKHRNPISGVWEEKHFKDTPSVPSDMRSHLYGLVVNADNSFEIQIDGKTAKSGDLLTSMEPPINPPLVIDDPEDKKPEDWVEEAKIADPDASKPDDWDEDAPARITDPDAKMPDGWMEEEEKQIPDPKAKIPEDWDEEEDGEWEAPMLANPACSVGCGKWEHPTISNSAYKGKWHAPKMENPAYIGVWGPKQISNPNHFEDASPYMLPKIDSVGIDIWTMQSDIIFDNIVIADDVSKAQEFAAKSWQIRNNIEDKMAESKKQAAGGISYVVMSTIQANPFIFGAGLIVVVGALIWFCCCSGESEVPPRRASPKKKPATSEGEDDADAKEDDTADVKAAAAAGAAEFLAEGEKKVEKKKEEKKKENKKGK